jgi:hypothetical protein
VIFLCLNLILGFWFLSYSYSYHNQMLAIVV